MWIRIDSFRLPQPVRAVLSSDGMWFFTGVDVAPNLEYYSRSYFARKFCPLQLRDITFRGLWSRFSKTDLNVRLVDIETLERHFPGRPAVRELRRIFHEKDENLLRYSLLYDRPSIRRDRPMEVEAVEPGDELFRGDVPMHRFLEEFKSQTMQLFEIMSTGLVARCEVMESEDAPMEVSVCFHDGTTVQYVRKE